MSDHLRLVLGTAQLGMPYGIANRTGQPNKVSAHEIIDTAFKNGISEFDTAQAYGASEEILGQIIEDLRTTNQAKITTKLHPDLNHLNHDDMIQAIEQSLKKLNINKLHCVMLHREETLDLWQKGLSEILESFISRGLVDHIGVSVYSPQRAFQAISTKGIEIIQLPSSILDKRFEKANVFESAEKEAKKIYIRSIFLQGLILMASEELPAHMDATSAVLSEVCNISRRHNVTTRHLALGYIKSTKPKAKLIIGIEQALQLHQVLTDIDTELPTELIIELSNKFNDLDEKIINPTLWRQ
jgi:aryl-alcohol dehydrogenase-like predicted oxidoreductase